jgi:hypothetical protein
MENLDLLKAQIQNLILETIGYENSDFTPEEYRLLAQCITENDKSETLVKKSISMTFTLSHKNFHLRQIIKINRFSLSIEALPVETFLGQLKFSINNFDLKKYKILTEEQKTIQLKLALKRIKKLRSHFRRKNQNTSLNIVINKLKLKR